ncbi:MAG TPA: site-specific integrase [Ruminococcus flavefaciens]|nr:site-specific integrase [Ruminococcus flavefaciens]
MQINVYHRKDGRWEGRIRKSEEKCSKRMYRYIYGKTKESVISMLQEIYHKEKTFHICDKILSQIFEEWFTNVKQKVKISTACNYLMKAKKHILPEFGEKTISSIQKDSLYSFIKTLQSKKLSSRYIRDILVLLSSVFKYAVNTYHIYNPFDDVVIPKKKYSDVKLLDEDEQQILRDELFSNPNRTTLGIALSYYTGIRIGELCALQWKDIDIEKRLLTVRKTVQRIQLPYGTPKTKVIITEPKSESSARVIPIPDCIITLMKIYKGNLDDFILSGKEKPTEPRTMQYRFNSFLKNAGLPSIHFHALRHLFASNCIKLGADVKSLSEILGHSSVEITLNRYVHSSFEMKREYLNRLDFRGK